jgi:tetratricopeptide (TPR) repeat protein
VDEWLRQARAASASGDAAAAEAAWRHSLALDPANPEACFHLGNLSRVRGDAVAAVEHYERGLRHAPGHAGLLNNLGQALEMLDRRDRAETCYREALATEPQHTEALTNLARLLFERGQFAAATATYDRLAEVPGGLMPAMWIQRGIAQQRIGDLRSAEASFREAAKLVPDDPAIEFNIATACFEQGRFAAAESAWLRVLELDPQNLYALSQFAHQRQHRCRWEGLGEVFAAIERLCLADAPEGREWAKAAPFTVLSMPLSPLTLLQVVRRWTSGFAREQAHPPAFAARAPGQRLRVGFVSSDFCPHPTSFLFMECWELLKNSERIETFGYAIFPPDRGSIGARFA